VRGIEPLRYTDGIRKDGSRRGSTSDESLQMIRGYHAEDTELVEFITGVQDYREADKYLGTFIAPMFLYMRRDRDGNWRIHPNFRVTRVVSGRLSSYDPNVLAFPTRSDLGKRIRLCFVAGEGWVLLSADMSQIELRLGAHFSRDRTMRQAFENGADLHALTGSVIFGIALELVNEVQRYVAKTINFAVFYGISAKALLEQLYKANIFAYTLEQCDEFIAEWFRLYSSVRSFQERLWKEAEREGFVRTLFGRICYVPNLRLTDTNLRDAARRLAGNFPVQGSAGDLVKRAETRVHRFIEDNGLRDQVRPWLQMHDELDIEVRAGRLVEEMREQVTAAMLADQVRVSVPLKVKVGVGDSWGTAK
jgi:DNA polymerase-1